MLELRLSASKFNTLYIRLRKVLKRARSSWLYPMNVQFFLCKTIRSKLMRHGEKTTIMTAYLERATSGPKHSSGYRLMWIWVIFDLPVDTRKQRHDATKFRQFLLDIGFEMSEFSNYLRFCNGKEQFESYVRKIECSLPERGNVYIFQFTDKQYENIVRFSDQARRKRQKNPAQLVLF